MKTVIDYTQGEYATTLIHGRFDQGSDRRA
jgi:hypothetical protein